MTRITENKDVLGFAFDPQQFSDREFIDENGILEEMRIYLMGDEEAGVKGSGNVILVGPKGTGKDHVSHQFAIDNKCKKVFLGSCSESTVENDFIGYPQPVGDGFEFVYGVLPAACKYGQEHPDETVIILLPEANLPSPGVLAVLNPFCDNTRAIAIPYTGEIVKRPDNVKLILTMNPWDQAGYRGTNQLNIAMMDRFDIIVVDYLSVREEVELLKQYNKNYETCKKWAEFAARTRTAYTLEGKLTNVITTRKLIDYVQHCKVLPEKTVVKRALGHFITDERQQVLKLWGDHNFDGV